MGNPKYRCSLVEVHIFFSNINKSFYRQATVVPTKSDTQVIFCLQLLSKTITFTLHLSQHKSIDHLCINPILRIGLIHK